MLFISQAWAQEAAVAAGQSAQDGRMSTFIIQAILIFGVIWLFLIRPQQRKYKQHEAMLKSLSRKDKIVLAGGIVGTIERTDGDDELIVEIAENVRVRVLRGHVADLYTSSGRKPTESLVQDITPAKKADKASSKADALKDVLTKSGKK